MDRRDFLSVSATSALTLTTLPGLRPDGSPPPAVPEPPVEVEMGEYVERLDAGLARIGQWTPSETLTAMPGDPAQGDRLIRATVQSLFVTGMLGDLPLQQQLDPRLQERVERALPIFDEAVDGMEAFLESRTDDDFRETQARLREPGVSERLIKGLVAEAENTGVSPQRTRQLREMLEHVTWRLAQQPPALIVREYLDKSRRMGEDDLEGAARQAALAARLGQAAPEPAPPQEDRRVARRKRGARLMGIGVITFGLSGALVALGAFPAVFGMTVGAVMTLVGLIMYLTGKSAPTPPAADSTSTTARPSGAR